MGDIADYLADLCIEDRIQYEFALESWLRKSDDELKQATAESRLPIVMSIRKFKKLSHKQRVVLANWLVERDHQGEE